MKRVAHRKREKKVLLDIVQRCDCLLCRSTSWCILENTAVEMTRFYLYDPFPWLCANWISTNKTKSFAFLTTANVDVLSLRSNYMLQ